MLIIKFVNWDFFPKDLDNRMILAYLTSLYQNSIEFTQDALK